MICKYCGALYEGNKCSTCGKVIPLVKRSTDLDILMSSVSKPPVPVRPTDGTYSLPSSEKTFEKGLKEGYQRGLKEGYENGFKDGKSIITNPPRPNIKRFAILCAMFFFIGAAISGIVSSKVSYNSGYRNGTDNGIIIAKSTFEPQIDNLNDQHQAELEQAKIEAHTAGHEEALREMATPSDTPTSSPVPTVTTETPLIFQFDFPYSKARNGGTTNEVVRAIQSRLKELGYKEVGKIDGDFGDNTTMAIRNFQKKEGLDLDKETEKFGEVGILTYLALFPDAIISTDDAESQEGKEEESTPSGETNSTTKEINLETTQLNTTLSPAPVKLVTPKPDSLSSETENGDDVKNESRTEKEEPIESNIDKDNYTIYDETSSVLSNSQFRFLM